MRDDLLDAKAAADWAVAQIPILENRLKSWQRSRPYETIIELDPDSADKELLVAYLRTPLDPLIQGDIGAIINSTRTALDLLMSAVLMSHGVKPNSDAHFPIKKTSADFLKAIEMMEIKKWVAPCEAAAIKTSRAYKGGHPFFYAIHQLDILRKHERLIVVNPLISEGYIRKRDASEIEPAWRALDDKTILFKCRKGGFDPTKRDTNITAQIFFNEPALGIPHNPAIAELRVFTASVGDFIERFP